MPARPLVVWGLDPIACSVAELLPEPSRGNEFRWLFKPGAEALRELRDLVVKAREEAKTRLQLPEPEVSLLASSFVPQADHSLEILQQVSDVLAVALPGAQSISLTVLLAPATAGSEEKIRMFRFFQGLEGLVGCVRFLDIAFVNRLPTDLFEEMTASASAGERPSNGLPEEELREVLCRQLIDPAVRRHIEHTGFGAIRNKLKVCSIKCSYSTVGACYLRYYRPETLAHLKARFQLELFRRGFMDEESLAVDKGALAFIQGRADQFVNRHIESLRAKVPQVPAVSASALKQSFDPAKADEKRQACEEEIRGAFGQIKRPLARLLKSLNDCAEDELQKFLAEAPSYLAGGKQFVDALEGRRLLPPPKGEATQSGKVLFEWLFCIEPYLSTILEIFKEHYEAILALVAEPVPEREEDESELAWAANVLDAIGTRLPHLRPEVAAQAGLFRSAFRLLMGSTPHRPGEARTLVGSLLDTFIADSRALFPLIQRRVAELEQARADLLLLSVWFRRRFVRRAAYRQKLIQIKELERDLSRLNDAHSAMHKLLTVLLNSVAVANIVRADINVKFHEEIEKTARGFSSFVAALSAYLAAQWQGVTAVPPQYSRTTAATVLDSAGLEELYGRIVGEVKMQQHAGQTLAFRPCPREDGAVVETSYDTCNHLGDHYRQGHNTLLDRLANYSEYLFQPVQRMDILDMIELHGVEKAAFYLSRKIREIRQFLGFSEAMLPQVHAQQVLNDVCVVRTAAECNSRLADAGGTYRGLFGPQVEFLDSGDPDEIHISCLRSGFPAFAIHALHEGRDLARAQDNGLLAPDLWPV